MTEDDCADGMAGLQFLDSRLLRHGLPALKCLPRMEPRGELMIDATNVHRVDGWLATSLRALIEFRARDQQVRVVLSPPAQAGARRLLRALLGEPPSKFIWSGKDPIPDSRALTAWERKRWVSRQAIEHRVILPATRFTNHGVEDAAAWRVPELARTVERRRETDFIIGAFCELVENGLTHGRASPVGTLGTITADLRRQYVEAIVVDLGPGVVNTDEFAAGLGAPMGPTRAGLAGITELARRRALNATVTLVTGGSVQRWRSGWRAHAIGRLPGFAAGVRVDF